MFAFPMTVLVFQHVEIGSPGIFGRLMQHDALAFDTVKLYDGQDIPDLRHYRALIVLGGPMNVWDDDRHPWLHREKHAIREFALTLRRPILGICLGHQLLAEALGGTVGPMEKAEIGISPVERTQDAASDFLFSQMPASFDCVQWHGSEIKTLPPGASVLARNDLCSVQAFRVAQHAYGVQFHPEVETATINRWVELRSFREMLTQNRGPRAVTDFSANADRQMSGFNRNAETLYRQFRQLAL